MPNLPDENRRRRVVEKRIRAVGCNQLDAPLAQHLPARLLHDQITRKPMRALDENGADPVASNAGEQRHKTCTVLQPIRALDRCVIRSRRELFRRDPAAG